MNTVERTKVSQLLLSIAAVYCGMLLLMAVDNCVWREGRGVQMLNLPYYTRIARHSKVCSSS